MRYVIVAFVAQKDSYCEPGFVCQMNVCVINPSYCPPGSDGCACVTIGSTMDICLTANSTCVGSVRLVDNHNDHNDNHNDDHNDHYHDGQFQDC